MAAEHRIKVYMRDNGDLPPCEGILPDGERCSNKADTVDHITPRRIAALLDWTERELGSPENKQYLCKPCHTAKDIDTPQRVRVLEEQLAGRRYVGLGEHDRAMEEVKEHAREEQRQQVLQRNQALLMQRQQERQGQWRKRKAG